MCLLTVEIRKLFKHPLLWIGLAALVFLLLLFTLVHHSQIKYGFIPATGGLEQDLLAGLSFYNWIGGFVYAVTASVITAYDYPDLRLWLSRGISRPGLLLARLTVIILVSGLLVCLSILTTLGLAALSRILFFGAVDASQLNVAAILPVTLRIFWSSLPYLALTMLLAVIGRSPIFAAGIAIVYVDAFEKLLLSISDRYPLLTRYLPGQLSLALQLNNYMIDQNASAILDTRNMTESNAFLVVGILSVSLCCLSFLIFSRQDLGGSQ